MNNIDEMIEIFEIEEEDPLSEANVWKYIVYCTDMSSHALQCEDMKEFLYWNNLISYWENMYDNIVNET